MKVIVNADSLKSIPEFMRPLMLRAAAYFTFDYSPEEWAKIAKSLESLNAKRKAIEKTRVRLRNSARSYLVSKLNGPGHARQKKERLRHWVKVVGLSHTLIKEFHNLAAYEPKNGPPNPDGSEREPYNAEMLALMMIKVMAESHVASLSGNSDDGYPKARPKAHFQFDVLEVWTSLGGKLGFSRHPHTKKIGGPLVRYFSAATEPVHGGSPESLPDVIERYEI
jgi:hypothetical protein